LLLEIFSQRHEHGSTIVTSNLPFEEWTSVFSNQHLTGALLDRLTHHVHILELNGESYRLRQSKARRRRDPRPADESPQPPIPKPAKSSTPPKSRVRPGYETPAISAAADAARGELPRNLIEAELRQKEIRFSSRTRAATHQFKQKQMVRRTVAKLLEKLPEDLRQTPEAEMLAEQAHEKVYNLIQLIYHAKNYEGCSKDYEFSRRTTEEHWKSGYTDAVRTLRHPEVLQYPNEVDGVFTFDLAEQDREGSAA